MENNPTSTGGSSLGIGYQLLWYQIEGLLGRGGFGLTYLARDTNLDRLVAIKEYLPTMFAQRDADSTVKPLTGAHGDSFRWGLTSFLKEAQILAKFKHHNIVQVHTVFEANGTAYMVMEYEQGNSLSTLMKSAESGLGQSFFENILFPIMGGLQLIHDAGFIHRDIKPANIYVREDHSPVLIDFGSARQTSVQNTGEMTALVTQGYTPLEQYSVNFGSQGPWTDIYALAASVYHAVAGKVPADALNRCAAVQTGQTDPFVKFSGIAGAGFTLAFTNAIDSALVLNPMDRPQSLNAWQALFLGRIEPAATQPFTPTVPPPDGQTVISPLRPQANLAAEQSAEQTAEQTYVQPLTDPAPTHTGSSTPGIEQTIVRPLDATGAQLVGEQNYPGNQPEQQTTNAPRAKRRVLVFSTILLVALAAGGWWYTQNAGLLLPGDSPSLSADTIKTLPRPDPPMMLSSPIQHLQARILTLSELGGMYTQAAALDENAAEAHAGLEYVLDEFESLTQSRLVQINPELRDALLKGLNAVDDKEARAQALSSTLLNHQAVDTTRIETLLNQRALNDSERQTLVYSLFSLSEADRQKLNTNRKLDDLSNQFKNTIVNQLKTGEFSNAIKMLELASLAFPTDSELDLLKQHLSQ